MIYIYCAAMHGTSHSLCNECSELNKYAQKRLTHCKYGEQKPTCKKCPTHCYASEMKTKMQEIMRFSGPRMIYRNPILAIKHLLKSFK